MKLFFGKKKNTEKTYTIDEVSRILHHFWCVDHEYHQGTLTPFGYFSLHFKDAFTNTKICSSCKVDKPISLK